MDMSEDEFGLMVMLIIVAGSLLVYFRSTALHPLFLTKNAALGLVRLVAPFSLAWTLFVILVFGDPSITGIYLFFYLLMAYVATAAFGISAAQLFGPQLRHDVYERKNFAAALFISAFAIATGVIFGGCLWGEADPNSEDEGGWWIPVSFFLLGWGVLVAALSLYLRRERYNFTVEIRQNRNIEVAKSVSIFLLSTAVVVVDGVAGDFYGWIHGLLTFGVVAIMLLVHELNLVDDKQANSSGGIAGDASNSLKGASSERHEVKPAWWLNLFFPAMAILAFLANRWLDKTFGGG